MKSKKIIITVVAIVTILCILSGGLWIFFKDKIKKAVDPVYGEKKGNANLVDDWKYDHSVSNGDGYVLYESSGVSSSFLSSSLIISTKSVNAFFLF